MNLDHPDWGYQPESPFGFPILNMEGWRRVFKTRPGELWTQYGELIPDPLTWLAEKKPWQPDPEWQRRWLDDDIERGFGWLDAEGFKFSTREFC